MNFLFKIVAYCISLPARIKGMKFGKNSFIGPGYDWLFIDLHGVIVGNNVMIGKNVWIQVSRVGCLRGKIFIRDGTNIGRNATISAIKKITIGKKCLISYNVSIFDHDHEVDNPKISPMEGKPAKAKETIIGDNCFIGAHSFILKGVKLGKHCVVGANSVVTKSFPAHSVVAGNPAKLIKKLNSTRLTL